MIIFAAPAPAHTISGLSLPRTSKKGKIVSHDTCPTLGEAGKKKRHSACKRHQVRQEEIGEKVGLHHTTIGERIKDLREKSFETKSSKLLATWT
jgi:hypothetical protein